MLDTSRSSHISARYPCMAAQAASVRPIYLGPSGRDLNIPRLFAHPIKLPDGVRRKGTRRSVLAPQTHPADLAGLGGIDPLR